MNLFNLRQAVRIAQEEVDYQIHCLPLRFAGGDCHRLLVNGSPKSGTTWLLRLLSSLPGYREDLHVTGDWDAYERAARGAVMHAHEPFSESLVERLQQANVKVVHIVRDPRDQTVSRLFHIRLRAEAPAHAILRGMEIGAALSHVITGLPAAGLPSARQLTELACGWLGRALPDIVTVRYELLLAEPIATMGQILGELDIPLSPGLLRRLVARNRFERLVIGKRIWREVPQPGTANVASHFRKGVAGDWKNHFSEEHKAIFKRVAGDLLIEMQYAQDDRW